MMKLTFLGSGSAFTTGDNYQSNVLIEAPSGRRLLIDCGSDVRWPLAKLGLGARDIDEVYISHLHADHIGGLEWLGFSTYFSKAPRPIMHVSAQMVAPLWEQCLKGGMGSIQGQIARLGTFFDPRPIGHSRNFTFEGIKFSLVQSVHVMDGFDLMPCYGLLFHIDNLWVYFTADTQLTTTAEYFYDLADVIFHDCETSPHPSGVHAHYNDLKDLKAEFRTKMYLYHYQDGSLPDAKADGFCGFVQPGQVFDLTRPETL